MDGLSGMKIYQTFIIDSKFLPLNYPEKLQFLIKGVSHTIDKNSWTTQIESFSIPKDITSDSSQDTSETEGEISDILNQFFVLPIKNGQPRGSDCAGGGFFGAPRTRPVSAKYPEGEGPHEGYDIKIPENNTTLVYAPISGILKSSLPYGDGKPLYVKGRLKNQLNNVNQGFKIQGTGVYEGITAYVHYVTFDKSLLGTEVEVGQVIGRTISRMNYALKSGGGYKYPTCMTPHVHYQVFENGGAIDPTPGAGLTYSETLYKA